MYITSYVYNQLVTGHDNTSTGHKTADQSWSWAGHDQLVISFTRPDFISNINSKIKPHSIA
jgi:hypothetical protein